MDSDQLWLRVFEHEISRRRRLHNEEPVLYKKIWSGNPKGLLPKEDCKGHCWVPATHLMIHDGTGKSYVIGGIKRRAFTEARSFTRNGYRFVRQICWNCDDTRERLFEIISTEERLARERAARPKKQRGRKPTQQVESIIDEFFEQ